MTGIFPLQIVSYPGELVNLHIFEERYKQLIQECIDRPAHFVIVAYIDGRIMPIGTLMSVQELVEKHEDGRMDIRCIGHARCKITDMSNPAPDKLYAGAEYHEIKDDLDGDGFKYDQIHALVLRFQELIKAEKKIIIKDEFRIYDIVHKIGLSLKQKYQILEYSDERSRQDFVIDHLQNIIPVIKRIEEAKRRISMNGHFPSYPSSDIDF